MNISENQKRIVPFIFYCIFILLIIILADLDKLPLFFLYKIPHYDWIAHFVLYGIFSMILNNFLKGKRIVVKRWNISLSFLLILGLIVGEEFSQLLFSSRTFSLIDIIMGISGVLFSLFIKNRYKTRT